MANWISTDDQGDHGQPGSSFSKCFAGVRIAKNGQYELHVRCVVGSNRGYLEEHSRNERRYRANDLDDLMRIGISEIRNDSEFDPADAFVAAIRNAIFEAQDIEAEQRINP